MKIKNVNIADVKIGKRRREDFGDINVLADSIGKYNLLHPITVDSHNNLVAGERRLRACKQLGWLEIPARAFTDLTADERREIELEENVRRKDLTPYERSKDVVALAEVAAKVLVQHTKTPNPKGGRPPKAGVSLQDVATRIGVPRETVDKARQHVAAVTKYPELAAHGIPQKDAITISKSLDALAEGERDEARSRIIAGDTNTKAMLAGKPPLPPPLPKQKRSVADNWHASIVKTRQLFVGIRDNGGITRIVSEWTDEDRSSFLSELEEMRGELDNIIIELEAQTYAISE